MSSYVLEVAWATVIALFVLAYFDARRRIERYLGVVKERIFSARIAELFGGLTKGAGEPSDDADSLPVECPSIPGGEG